ERHSVTTAYTMDQQGQWRRYEFSGDRLVVGFWERGEPVVRHDLWEDDPYQERVHLPRLRSVVDVPFSHGTLALSSREPRIFGDQHLALVLDMAGLLSEGFSRLEDLAALEQRNQELEAEMAERRRAEEQLRASLHEKEVLLKEIHHRVKNNLQIVSSLLNLQAGTIEDARTVAKLMDSRSRIESMALVHEKLYQSDTLDRIVFGDYLRALAAHVHGSYGEVGQRVRLRVEASPLVVDVDVAVPCGLVLNELLTNCLKYAFPDGRQGEILVELQALDDDRVRLRVSDDGVGLPAGLEIAQTHSLGMQLVGDLTTQLRGTLSLCREQGTAFEIVFPLAGS
ncbi:MAG: histidine kinase dimerization/phosphoacceptor domain -containing protein, partial [Candidatus Latescibacterota bacterium]